MCSVVPARQSAHVERQCKLHRISFISTISVEADALRSRRKLCGWTRVSPTLSCAVARLATQNGIFVVVWLSAASTSFGRGASCFDYRTVMNGARCSIFLPCTGPAVGTAARATMSCIVSPIPSAWSVFVLIVIFQEFRAGKLPSIKTGQGFSDTRRQPLPGGRPQNVPSTKVASSRFSPLSVVVNTINCECRDRNLTPFWRVTTSGSRVRFPSNMTLLKLAMRRL